MPSIKQLLNIEEIKSKFFFYQFVNFMKGFSKEIKIAVTAIIAIVVIYLGVIFLKGIKFSKSSNIFYVEMNDVNGLAASAPVLANGVQIGLVNSVRFVSDKQNVQRQQCFFNERNAWGGEIENKSWGFEKWIHASE